MSNNTWEFIAVKPKGALYRCKQCGKKTLYLGRGKYPSYSCPNCETRIDKQQADNIFRSMAH